MDVGAYSFDRSGIEKIIYKGAECEWFNRLCAMHTYHGVWAMESDVYDFFYDAAYNGIVLFQPKTAVAFGDINGDEEITSDDAVYLLNYTLFPELYPLSCGADFDRDEKITSDDAVYLLNYTLFPNLYPLEEQKP